MRRALVAGNWKMHKTVAEARRLVAELLERLPADGPEVMVAPPFTALHAVGQMVQGTRLRLGAQDVFWEAEGAFTGEISPLMLREVGCSYVIVGHSERRHLFGETDEMVRRKVRAALQHGLVPILCVGETLEQREAGRTAEVVSGQLRAALEGLSPREASGVVVAYEPVWAIGTGRTATPEQAQEVQGSLRRLLAEMFGPEVAEGMRVLYGGSVKPDNIASLMAQPDVDGALVGGASLRADSFLAIVEGAA